LPLLQRFSKPHTTYILATPACCYNDPPFQSTASPRLVHISTIQHPPVCARHYRLQHVSTSCAPPILITLAPLTSLRLPPSFSGRTPPNSLQRCNTLIRNLIPPLPSMTNSTAMCYPSTLTDELHLTACQI